MIMELITVLIYMKMGVGEDCATEIGQSLYNDLGTQNNNIYD